MFAEIIVIINFVDPLKCVSVARGCKLSQAFYRPFTEENAAEPSALGSPQAFLECRMPVLRFFFLNAYLCISRAPFVLSRFLLVPFVFSSQSDTDLANMVMESSSREKLLRELMRLGSSSLLCAMQLRYNKICWLSYILIGVFYDVACKGAKFSLNLFGNMDFSTKFGSQRKIMIS